MRTCTDKAEIVGSGTVGSRAAALRTVKLHTKELQAKLVEVMEIVEADEYVEHEAALVDAEKKDYHKMSHEARSAHNANKITSCRRCLRIGCIICLPLMAQPMMCSLPAAAVGAETAAQ